jgi:hydroxymethylbilane synthase
MKRFIIGTRQSQLAVWQAEYIADRLRAFHPDLEVALQFFVTQGDRVLDKPLPQIGGKGLFTAELEAALRSGEVDLAVHSLKDLPTDIDPAFTIGAIPERASVHDVLISRAGLNFADLPHGATIGTSSLRRAAQLRAARPDIHIESLRGNVPTRVQKALATDGQYDAIVLAEAGLDRLNLRDPITETLPIDLMLPAPAQGALAVQCRADDADTLHALRPLNHAETRAAIEAERAFLNALDSGCRLPVAALARGNGGNVHLTGRVISLDGSQMITVEGTAAVSEAVQLGRNLAAQALERGAGVLLDAIRAMMND